MIGQNARLQVGRTAISQGTTTPPSWCVRVSSHPACFRVLQALRRLITPNGWSSLLPKPGIIERLKTISGATNSVKLRSARSSLHMDCQVCSTLLACLPDICLFPKLRALDVSGFGRIPEVLAMFISPCSAQGKQHWIMSHWLAATGRRSGCSSWVLHAFHRS